MPTRFSSPFARILLLFYGILMPFKTIFLLALVLFVVSLVGYRLLHLYLVPYVLSSPVDWQSISSNETWYGFKRVGANKTLCNSLGRVEKISFRIEASFYFVYLFEIGFLLGAQVITEMVYMGHNRNRKIY